MGNSEVDPSRRGEKLPFLEQRSRRASHLRRLKGGERREKSLVRESMGEKSLTWLSGLRGGVRRVFQDQFGVTD